MYLHRPRALGVISSECPGSISYKVRKSQTHKPLLSVVFRVCLRTTCIIGDWRDICESGCEEEVSLHHLLLYAVELHLLQSKQVTMLLQS
jgi:hypothetical protein